MRTRTAGLAVLAALAAAVVTACAPDGPPAAGDTTAPAPPATTAPASPGTASATGTLPTGKTCKLLTTDEAAAILRVETVVASAPDDAQCTYEPEPRTDDTPFLSVTVDVDADVFADDQADARTGEGYRELSGLGDRAFFYASTVHVLAGETSFQVQATSARDLDKQWSQIRVATQEEYVRIGTEAARLVAARL
ncbi:MAG TPA: hypothetical protein VNA20_11515 [Frankiaceae bacterium]|nr:hypothetical protein [Frankiaceae bacterium]